MQHQQAINVIRRLGPELTKEAAESVLLRYATDEELAPAQLEKLAQAYNTVRQLSHIEASNDRGSSCHQIDTPALLRTYVEGGQKSASAVTTQERATHSASEVDLMRELRSEMRQLDKAASCGCDTPDGVAVTTPSTPAPDPEADVRFTPAQLKEAAWEAKVDLYMIADDILKMASCEGRVLQIAQAEHDASRVVSPLCVSESLNWLEKYAAQQKISRELSRHVGEIKPAAFNISTPLSEKVTQLAEAFALTSLLHKVATDVGIPIGQLPNSGKIDAPDPAAMEDVMARLDAFTPEGEAAPAPAEPKAFNVPAGEEPKASEPEEKSQASGQGGKGGGDRKKGGEKATDKGAPSGGGGKHWLAAIISGATKPVGAAAATVDQAASAAQNKLNMVTGKERVHRAQVDLDNDVMDIRRSILIRRLAASDPVLKEMPIRDVLDTYNAIAESNPDLAANPRRVLLAMREAASYEGLTLDSQKLLGDVRGATAKTDEQESNNTKRRYSA